MNLLSFIHWNFNPELFHLGSITVRWYGLMFAISFILGLRIVEKEFKFEKIDLKWLDSLLIYIVVGTVVGARLGHVFFYGWADYAKNPIEILYIWHGGLASHGGALGVFIALLIHSYKYSKKSVFWTIDRISFAVALAAMFIRLGNLFNSEIYGVQTSLPWGFIFERNNETVPKHPTQLYEAISYFITFLVLRNLYWKTDVRNKTGVLTGVMFIMIFVSRFLIEFIKEDQEAFEATMQLNMGQWLSIPFILGGIFLIYRGLNKNAEA